MRVNDERGFVVLDASVWSRMPELGSAVLVYIALLTFANGRAGDVWPKHETIAQMTGMGVSTVKEKLSMLEKAELIEIGGRAREDGGQASNNYRILAGGVAKNWLGGSQNLATNKTQLNNTKTTPATPGVGEKMNAIIKAYHAGLVENGRVVSDGDYARHTRTAKDLATLGYSPQEVIDQVRRMTGETFWRGKYIPLSSVRDQLVSRGAPASKRDTSTVGVLPAMSFNPFEAE